MGAWSLGTVRFLTLFLSQRLWNIVAGSRRFCWTKVFALKHTQSCKPHTAPAAAKVHGDTINRALSLTYKRCSLSRNNGSNRVSCGAWLSQAAFRSINLRGNLISLKENLVRGASPTWRCRGNMRFSTLKATRVMMGLCYYNKEMAQFFAPKRCQSVCDDTKETLARLQVNVLATPQTYINSWLLQFTQNHKWRTNNEFGAMSLKCNL